MPRRQRIVAMVDQQKKWQKVFEADEVSRETCLKWIKSAEPRIKTLKEYHDKVADAVEASADREVEKAIFPLVKKEVGYHLFDIGAERLPRMDVSWDVDSDWKPSIKVDPANETITITDKEISVISK